MSPSTKAVLARFLAILLGSSAFGSAVNLLFAPQLDWRTFGGALLFSLVMAAEKLLTASRDATAEARTNA
jgi:hypothetical protein